MAVYKYQIWIINTRTQSLQCEPVLDSLSKPDDRGLSGCILFDEVDATLAPLGLDHRLIFGLGLLEGDLLKSIGHIVIGDNSLLKGAIKEAISGGRKGQHMAHMGIKAFLIKESPKEGRFWVLHPSLNSANWEKVDNLAGLGIYEVEPKLTQKYGYIVAIVLIGLGDLGAVMGSKAIMFDYTGGQKPHTTNLDAFNVAQKDFTKAGLNHPQSSAYHGYGTVAMAHICDGFGGLLTRNSSSGHFENAEYIIGETLRDFILTRGKTSDPSHTCMAGS